VGFLGGWWICCTTWLRWGILTLPPNFKLPVFPDDGFDEHYGNRYKSRYKLDQLRRAQPASGWYDAGTNLTISATLLLVMLSRAGSVMELAPLQASIPAA